MDGREVEVPDDGSSLLEVLRDRLGARTPKDGCSPQGQCGCCTVWVDGSPRVACVTPARRVAGRDVTTLEGLDPVQRSAWADAFYAAGASQCGFCTPGIVMRLAALAGGRTPSATAPAPPARVDIERALLAHLCRCTGWRSIVDAALSVGGRPSATAATREREAAARRAALEGGVAQSVGPEVALGGGGFADDTAPEGALVAVPDGAGGWALGETLHEARRAAGKVQGRRTPGALRHPLEVPAGSWDLTLRTTWVEPAYLETDASWCEPGGVPASPLANGGAFGGKAAAGAPAVARRLADESGRPVRVLLSREDVVRTGPKRPPVAAGMREDGTGSLRVVRTPGVAGAVHGVAPGLAVEEVDVPGPPTSLAIRGAGWAEPTVMLSALAALRAGARAGEAATVTAAAPSGGEALATVDDSGVRVRVRCGDPLDPVVLRSYCTGAAHMGLGWVTSEGLAVDDEGVPRDLTIRSFGILRAQDMPPVDVEIDEDGSPPVNGSEAVLAAVAAAAWIREGLPPEWPTRRTRS